MHRSHLLCILVCVIAGGNLFTPQTNSQSGPYSLSLNGSSQYVSVPNSTSIDISGPITIEAWIKLNSATGSYRDIACRVAYGQAGTGGGYELGISDGGKIRLDLYQSPNTYTTVIGSSTVSASTWHHVAAVFDGSQMRIYLDGSLDGSVSTSSGPATGTSPLRIGTSTYGNYYFAGLLDDVRISAAALYSSNFTAGLGTPNNTRGHWTFNGQTADDSSSNGNHGTLQNGPAFSNDVWSVSNVAPAVNVTDPLNNTSFSPGATVVIDAAATDADGLVTKVEFYQGTTLLGTDVAAPYSFLWTNVAAGSYSLTAKAFDNSGATTVSSAVALIVGSLSQQSLSLNGSSQYVSVPNSTSIDISGPITIEAWIKLNSATGSYRDIACRVAYGQAGTGGGYELGISDGGKIRLDLYQSPNTYTTVIGSSTVSASTWHHVAAVFDGSQMRVYLDGSLDGSVSTSSGPATGTSPLRIGTSTYGNYYFAGLLDDVRISAAALYSSNFTAGLGTSNNTRGHWTFNGQTADDSSSNGNHGTLQNSPAFSNDVPNPGGGSSGSQQRPVPVAGGPYNGQAGQSVSLLGNGSFDPDGTITSYHWNFGDGTSANSANPTHAYTAIGLYTATLTVTDNANLRSSATAIVTVSGSSVSRLDPRNQTGGGGENPLSQNFNWNLPIVSLPGRSGTNLGLSLSYNSLVWTRNGNSISFDEDRGFPSPGFRLGFPVIQPQYFNTETGKSAHLLISPDGNRTELRQVGSSNLFESADSAHLLFDNGTLLLRSTDGAQLYYAEHENGYVCTRLKDRNGNFITINYDDLGNLSSVVDTLGRTITFAYVNGNLSKIVQSWSINGSPATHTWATFEYIDKSIETEFTNVSLQGPTNGTILKLLAKVTLADNSEVPANNSHFEFDYTSYGQVWKISHYAADNHLLNYQAYNLPKSPLAANAGAQSDCPRFTERRDWARYANGDIDGTPSSPEEAVTTFAEPWTETWTMPTGASVTGTVTKVGTKLNANTYVNYNKLYFIGTPAIAGWQRGLPALVQTYDEQNALQRQVVTLWEQDDETKSFPVNPRVRESWIIDATNQKRVKTEYSSFSLPNNLSCKLPTKVLEYDVDASSVVRSTWIDYKMDASYTSSYVLGLVKEKVLRMGSNGGYVSWVAYDYDINPIAGSDAPTQHDNTNYGSSFVAGRGNLTSVKRYDVTNGDFTQTTFAFNNSGSVVSIKDHLNHETVVSYVDSFSDKTNTSTYAYPTSVTDPMGAINKWTYDFDFGAATSTQGTAPNLTYYAGGAIQYFEYFPYGALKKVTNSVNSSYVRYEYPADQLKVKTFGTIEAGKGEASSFVFTDGFGRTIGTAAEHETANNFKFSGQRLKYDVIGRVIESSNPTETTAEGAPFEWTATGDDATNGWVFTKQTYDWKDRPRITTNPSLTASAQDTTTRTIEYAGCGCAGGEVATITDEGTVVNGVVKTRQQKVYADNFGRAVKAEVYDFEGTGPSGGRALYSTTINNYNLRDQLTLSRKFAGAAPTDSSDLSCPTGACQRSEMTYDGFGRVKMSHVPVQQPETNNTASSDHTTFYYNGDDTIAYLIDARGVVKHFSYNGRRQVTGLNYDFNLIPPAYNRIAPTASATFEYDLAGNRTRMIDGTGSVSYHYNSLMQLESETRQFVGPLSSNSFALNYQYNLAGELQQMQDHTNTVTTYQHNKVGQLTKVSGNLIPQISNDYATGFHYRAWGGLKEVNFTNSTSQSIEYNRQLQPTSATLANVRTGTMTQNGDLSWSYSYYPDASQRQMLDANDDRFDRLFEYDLAGRVKEAYSGREARGQSSSNPADSPFRQSYTYNAFDEPISKSGRFWRTSQSGTEPCLPRSSTDGCDAEGNVLAIPYGNQTYDAESRQVHHVNLRYVVGSFPDLVEPAIEIAQTYDALGRVTKREETRRREELVNGGPDTEVVPSVSTTYNLYSSVLRAKVIELDEQGQKVLTYVYANGARLGKFQSGPGGGFSWSQSNPGSNSWIESTSGGFAARKEMDADGADVGTEDPAPVQPPTYERWHDEQPLYIEGGDPFDYVSGYSFNGLPMTKAEKARIMNKVGPAGLLAFARTAADVYHVPDYLAEEIELYNERQLSEFYSGTLQGDLRGIGFEPGGVGGSGTNKDPQNPSPNEAQPLSDCVKNLLAKYFDRGLLDSIRIHTNGLPNFVPDGMAAYTSNDNVYYALDQYDPHSARGIAVIGHEVTHSEQYRQTGNLRFKAKYLFSSFVAGIGVTVGSRGSVMPRFDSAQAYYGNKYEKESERKEQQILSDLNQQYGGGNPCP